MQKLQSLTASQRDVLYDASSFIINRKRTVPENQYMVIDSRAGVGKTYTINQFTSYLQGLGYSFLVTSFTGRACSQLNKTGLTAQTCHSILYNPILDDEGNLVRFETRSRSEILQDCGQFIVVDEASMLPLVFHDIFSSLQLPIIYAGDSNQLPPVDDKNPDFNPMTSVDGMRSHLTENMRFSDDSGIFWLSKRLMEEPTIPRFAKREDLRIVPKRRINEDFLAENNFDAILCGTNAVRHRMNRMSRVAFGTFNETPERATVGDRVICLRNDVVQNRRINNGEVYNVINEMVETDEITRYFIQSVDDPDVQLWVRVSNSCWESEWSERKCSQEEPLQSFGYGYAFSVHKSQGSSIRNVLFLDEDVSYFLDQRRFRYTAVTRASDSLTIGMI